MNPVTLLDPHADEVNIGAKAANLLVLGELSFCGLFQVPRALILPAEYEHIAQHEPGLGIYHADWAQVENEVYLHLGQRLAVRSSPLVSMPGQLETVVDVPNADPRTLNTRALHAALRRVIGSWYSESATKFRALYRLDQKFGMGIVIQNYVAPEPGSWAGTYFSRNPHTGAEVGIIEALEATTGGELVGGRQTPSQELPLDYQARLRALQPLLESRFGGPVDVEFVFSPSPVAGAEPILYLVQARLLRHIAAPAAARIAASMQRVGILTPQQAESLVNRRDSKAPWWLSIATTEWPVAQGLGAVSGAVSGRVFFGPKPAQTGADCLYVAEHTFAEEVVDMVQCGGILTHTGGQTSHAALEAMRAGIPAVVGANFTIENNTLVLASGERVAQGEWLTIDGLSGLVYRGRQPLVDRRIP
jgi:pyruvate,orthophosphate dikinase